MKLFFPLANNQPLKKTNTNSIRDNNFRSAYLPFTIIANYNLELKKCITRFHFHNRNMYIRSTTRAARETFKINSSEAVYIYIRISATIVFIIITKARANPTKPLRLLLRIALAFLPFGQKRKSGRSYLSAMLFILLIRLYCARSSACCVNSPYKFPRHYCELQTNI